MDKKVVSLKKRDDDWGNKIMSTMAGIKPIQATPEIKGNDAYLFLEQVFTKPSEKEVKKNKKLLSILNKIQK